MSAVISIMIKSRFRYSLFAFGAIFWLFSISIVETCFAKGKTFYVDAVNGKDTFSGLGTNMPWKSLEKVNQQTFEPGDIILFKSGSIFKGQLHPQGSGSANQEIVISSYGKGALPQINAEGKFKSAVYFYNQAYWEIKNLQISNQGDQREANRCGVLVEIKNFGTAKNIALDSLTIHDINGSLIKKEGGGAAIVFSNSGSKTPSRFDGLVISNCTIKNAGRNGILINGNWQRTHWFPNLNVKIHHNLLEGVPGDGIVPIGCDGALIEFNRIKDCPRLLPDGEAAAGIWPWSSDNTLVQFNEVSDHKAPWDAQGFDSDWNCLNTVIQYNYSHNNEGGFLLICNDGSSKEPINAGNKNSIIRCNISINDGFRSSGKHAGFSPIVHVAGPATNAQIYNNIVLNNQTNRDSLDNNLLDFTNWNGEASEISFHQNIVSLFWTSRIDNGSATNITIKDNLVLNRIDNLSESSNQIIVHENKAYKQYQNKLNALLIPWKTQVAQSLWLNENDLKSLMNKTFDSKGNIKL